MTKKATTLFAATALALRGIYRDRVRANQGEGQDGADPPGYGAVP